MDRRHKGESEEESPEAAEAGTEGAQTPRDDTAPARDELGQMEMQTLPQVHQRHCIETDQEGILQNGVQRQHWHQDEKHREWGRTAPSFTFIRISCIISFSAHQQWPAVQRHYDYYIGIVLEVLAT